MANDVSPTPEQASTLSARVFALVRACPEGRVTTYGALAKAVGYPRGARMVGWIMNETPEGVPAQRVINSKGELSGSWAFGSPGLMRPLLEAEGIIFLRMAVLTSNATAGIHRAISVKKSRSRFLMMLPTLPSVPASACYISCAMTRLR